MAIQTINVGTIANDGTGDDLREAFVKVNSNFAELDVRDSENTTAANLGASGQGIFAQLSGTELQFKKLVGGSAVTLTSDANTVTINSTATGLPSLQVFADNNNITIDANNNNLTIAGGANTTTNLSGNTITVSSETVLATDLNPNLGANLDGRGFKIFGTSNVESNVYGIDIREMDGIQDFINGWDLGDAFPSSFNNVLQYLAYNLVIDFEDDPNNPSFTASSAIELDNGTLPVA
jgi:hypothetical protein